MKRYISALVVCICLADELWAPGWPTVVALVGSLTLFALELWTEDQRQRKETKERIDDLRAQSVSFAAGAGSQLRSALERIKALEDTTKAQADLQVRLKAVEGEITAAKNKMTMALGQPGRKLVGFP